MEEKLETIKKIILEEIDCEAIVLFGSYARGTQNKESDIDIAIKTKKEISKKELFYLSQQIDDTINIEVDLVNLDNIGDGFRYEILINGTTIYCEDEFKFELYKLDMYREYLELNESRKLIIDRMKEGETNDGK
ncbi:MAG: nucleotidyltransferase domain-containing protein [Clostridia bacterium]|nr:nucleotidyltransferase domain-containing protein [Clostridia bacterium]